MNTAPKQKRCKVCGELFQPRGSFHRACSPKCAIALKDKDHVERVKKAERLREKRENNRRKREHNWTDRAWLTNEAQKAFNRFIRLRDAHLPCISCGETRQHLKYDAGHYRTVGANPELRFEELNVHKQCSFKCNQTRSGNRDGYREGLLAKIGQEKLDWLEGPHAPKNYTMGS